MNTPAKAVLILLFANSLWAWSQSSPSSGNQPLVSEIAANFTNYSRITKDAVYVNPELARLCVGVSKAQVENARIDFGPHANTAIMIYMNKLAADAFASNAVAYPVGAVIVKQKEIQPYMDKNRKQILETNTGVGGMVKRPIGYDSTNGDWEYFYFEDTAKIESGPISTCVQCHSSAKAKDYVFGTWRKTGD